jgi:hypothetical protein
MARVRMFANIRLGHLRLTTGSINLASWLGDSRSRRKPVADSSAIVRTASATACRPTKAGGAHQTRWKSGLCNRSGPGTATPAHLDRQSPALGRRSASPCRRCRNDSAVTRGKISANVGPDIHDRCAGRRTLHSRKGEQRENRSPNRAQSSGQRRQGRADLRRQAARAKQDGIRDTTTVVISSAAWGMIGDGRYPRRRRGFPVAGMAASISPLP